MTSSRISIMEQLWRFNCLNNYTQIARKLIMFGISLMLYLGNNSYIFHFVCNYAQIYPRYFVHVLYKVISLNNVGIKQL